MRKVPCEIYSRVVGYYTRKSNMNLGKQAEFDDRVAYDLQKSLVHGEMIAEGVLLSKAMVAA